MNLVTLFVASKYITHIISEMIKINWLLNKITLIVFIHTNSKYLLNVIIKVVLF